MGKELIEQPDGRYAVWSTVADGFVSINNTKKEATRQCYGGDSDRTFDYCINFTACTDGPDKANHILAEMGLPERDFTALLEQNEREIQEEEANRLTSGTT